MNVLPHTKDYWLSDTLYYIGCKKNKRVKITRLKNTILQVQEAVVEPEAVLLRKLE
jgi:hypothetical protein